MMFKTTIWMAGVLAMLACVVGLSAQVASAPSLEITNEDTQQHCTAVTLTGTDVDGGCLGHAASEGVELRKHVFGVESHTTVCQLEFEGRLDEDATGFALEQIFSGANCSRQACAVGGEATPWPVQGAETAGTEHITANFCIEPLGGGTDETCEIDIPFDQDPSTHTVELGIAGEMAGHGISGFRCEVIGHWVSETGGTHDGDAEGDLVVTHL
jgi:hypothetical protein